MLDYWLLGLAMMLIVEGVMPFVSPGLWRETFRKLLTLKDGQLRFVGMTAMLSGIILLYWIK